MLLNNSHIQLRALELEDIDILYRWENTTGLWLLGNTLAPYSKFALKRYITETQLSDIYESKQLRMMIELVDDKTTIGIVDLYEFDIRNSRAGVGILIDEAYRGQQYASQALELIENYTFIFLGLHQLFAYISSDNKASLRLFANAGYTHSGTLQKWVQINNTFEDVQIVQLINNKPQ